MNKYISWFINYVLPTLIVSVVITIVAYVFSGEDRQLGYKVVSTTEIGALRSDHLPNIKISYGSNPIEHGGIITIKLENTGNSPISPREFDGPIEIHLDTNSDFLASKVVSTTPKNIKPLLSLSEGAIKIAPLLLNKNDAITIQAIATGNLKTIRVIGRIGGINEITNIEESKKHILSGIYWLLVLYALLAFTSSSVMLFNVLGGNETISRSAETLIIFVCQISAIFALILFFEKQEVEPNFGQFLFIIIVLTTAAQLIAIPFHKNKQHGKSYSVG